MAAQQWFVYPVEYGVELVIDSSDPEIYDAALVAFVTEYMDYNIASEWSIDGGEVIAFVPAPVDAPVESAVESPVDAPVDAS